MRDKGRDTRSSEPADGGRANGTPPDQKPRHVLVVNDTKEILDAFRALLEDDGYRVSLDNFSAMDLGEKLADVKALAPDAIILDFMFGAEPLGWQFLQLLKMDRTTEALPVVICTAAVRQAQEQEAHLRTLGVEVVLKPFDIDHVLDALRRALDAAGNPVAPGVPPTP
jgi:CheY-like chemotaxis protein